MTIAKTTEISRRAFLGKVARGLAGATGMIALGNCGNCGTVERYSVFLSQNPTIRESIVFPGHGKYDNWTKETKGDLFRYLDIFNTGGAFPYLQPPIPQRGSSFRKSILTDKDTWNLYLASIAFSLYVEVNNLVPWSITKYSSKELALLFTYRERPKANPGWMTDVPTLLEDPFSFEINSLITAWNPRFCYQFLLANKIVGGNQAETIYAFTDLCRKGLYHGNLPPYELTQLYNYAGAPPIDRVLVNIPKMNAVIGGCYGATALYKTVLRSINIPVEEDGKWTTDPTLSYHSRAVFPTVGLAVPHSDNLYHHVRWGLYRVPTDKLFISISDLKKNYSLPLSALEIHKRIRMNLFLLEKEYLTDSWIISRCIELLGPPYFYKGKRSLEEELARDPSTAEERVEIISRIDKAIESLGGPMPSVKKLEGFRGRPLIFVPH